jgi:ankyrin repeat protein
MQKITYALLISTLIFSSLTPQQTIFDDVRAGNKAAIRKRLENCENCAETDENGNNALHIAGEEGKPEHEEIIDMLTTQPDYSGWSNWFYGCFYAPTLPNKNEKNKKGKVPLRSAIDRGNIGTTEKLIVKGANTEITDEEGISPTFAVVKQNKPQLISILARHQLIQQKLNGKNILHYAIEINQIPMVDRLATDTSLTQEENNEGKTPAMLAAEKNDASCLRILHVKGVNLNARNHFGRQPIHSSAFAGSYEAAKYLLENDAYVDSTDNNDDTPLLISTVKGNKDVFDLFLAHKADAKKRNKQGRNILALAMENRKYVLIERITKIPGININEQDALGQTPFINAVLQKDHLMMGALSQAGADMHTADYQGETALHKIGRNGDTNALSELFPTHKNIWNNVNNDGNTAIFIAAENGHFNIITMLMHGGASLEGTNNNGETIFHQFAKSKNPFSFDATIAQYKPRMDINARSKSGLSAIHYAVANKDVEMMKMCIQYGAVYTDLTPDNDTLAHTAAKSGALNALKELKYRMPMMLQQRNKNNHTPFITAAANGHFDSAQFLFCENDIINRDISIAISLARAHGHTHIVQSLEQTEKKRMDECVKIARQPQEMIEIEKQITSLHQQLAEKDPSYFFKGLFRAAASPKQYSANELYYMTEAQRTQISLGYTQIYNQVLQKKKELKNELNTFIAQEEKERKQEKKRIREAKKQEQARIEEQNRRERELQVIQKRNAEIEAERRRELELKKQQHTADLAQIKGLHHYEEKKLQDDATKKAQQVEIDRCNKEKAAKDTQQAILDQAAATKARADQERIRQQQHAAALDKQQAHVPMNLQPSAPPMEQKIVADQCSACGGKAPSKPLPCVKCKKKVEGICATCVKKYAGRCPHCYDLHTLGIEKQKGECCIGVAACTEEKGVTVIPCTQCKKESSTDRICAGCLEACIKDNIKKGQKDKCPRCTQNTLDESLTKKILS